MPVNLGESKIFSPYSVYLNQLGGDRFKYSQLHEKLRKLPSNLQDFVFDTIPGDFIKDRISLPLNLDENQSKETAKIVLELIFADFYLGDIIDKIKERIGVDESKAKTIAGLIVTELFAPILDDLKKTHLDKFAKGQTVQQSVQAPSQGDDRVVNLKNQ